MEYFKFSYTESGFYIAKDCPVSEIVSGLEECKVAATQLVWGTTYEESHLIVENGQITDNERPAGCFYYWSLSINNPWPKFSFRLTNSSDCHSFDVANARCLAVCKKGTSYVLYM